MNKVVNDPVIQLNAPVEFKIIAHRGASRDAPENTIKAFELAWKQGADAIEGDFHQALDGRIVCVHDFSAQSDSTSNFPLLGDVLSIVPAGKGIYIEIKCGPVVIPALLEALEHSNVSDRQVTVIAFDEEVIHKFKTSQPAISGLWLTKLRKSKLTGRLRPSAETIIAKLEKMGADGVGCEMHSRINEKFVSRIREAGFSFHVWTVDDPKTARRLFAMGVDSITTNVPGRMREALAEEQA